MEVLNIIFFTIVSMMIFLHVYNTYLIFFKRQETIDERMFSSSLNSINTSCMWLLSFKNYNVSDSATKTVVFALSFMIILSTVVSIILQVRKHAKK